MNVSLETERLRIIAEGLELVHQFVIVPESGARKGDVPLLCD